MSERQKRKKAKELEKASMSPKVPPTKLQKSVTHWLRKNVPTKKTKFLHAHVVEYFAASKAIGIKFVVSEYFRVACREGLNYSCCIPDIYIYIYIYDFFTLDALLNDSPWARSKMNEETLDKSELNFSSREQCVVYLDELLRHKMFHRAKKIPVAEKSSKKDKKDKGKSL